VLDTTAHLGEQRLGAREILRRRSGDAEQLALARRPDGAADRALDEGPPARALSPRARRRLGLHGAHVDEGPASPASDRQGFGS
jgi:hypothetical protein